MPLRYWFVLALILATSTFVHFQFGEAFSLPIGLMVWVSIFGALAGDAKPTGS
jgi:hypothetical protein